MPFPDDLIDQARALTTGDPRRPRQANLRRAVSAAYYAVFHQLTENAARSILTVSDSAGPIGARLRRTVPHANILKACKWFIGPSGASPDTIRAMRAQPASTVDPALARAARLVLRLQQERHRADYDLASPFTRDEALRRIDDAEAVLGILRAAECRGDALIFLLVCVLGDTITRNP